MLPFLYTPTARQLLFHLRLQPDTLSYSVVRNASSVTQVRKKGAKKQAPTSRTRLARLPSSIPRSSFGHDSPKSVHFKRTQQNDDGNPHDRNSPTKYSGSRMSDALKRYEQQKRRGGIGPDRALRVLQSSKERAAGHRFNPKEGRNSWVHEEEGRRRPDLHEDAKSRMVEDQRSKSPNRVVDYRSDFKEKQNSWAPERRRRTDIHNDAKSRTTKNQRSRGSYRATGHRSGPKERQSSWADEREGRRRTYIHEDTKPRTTEDQRSKGPYRDSPTEDQPESLSVEKDIEEMLHEEFSPTSISSPASAKETPSPSRKNLPAAFTSPPLLSGLHTSLLSYLGSRAKPTAIQSLSLDVVVPALNKAARESSSSNWRQFLLASETGSGKSMAYLMPVVQYLKLREQDEAPSSSKDLSQSDIKSRSRSGVESLPLTPRALLLAPTHELTRQLARFAKALVHNVKLRVLCASRDNIGILNPAYVPLKKQVVTADNEMGYEIVDDTDGGKTAKDSDAAEFTIRPPTTSAHPVDLVVATPRKVLELVYGREKRADPEDDTDSGPGRRVNRGYTEGTGIGVMMGLENIEVVVVDEADVLYDNDFRGDLLRILSAISSARGQPVPVIPVNQNEAVEANSNVKRGANATNHSVATTTLGYPFHLLLTTATLPSSLSSFLETYHPRMVRLASPGVHKLPRGVKVERVEIGKGGGSGLDIEVERRIRRVWSEEATRAGVNFADDSDYPTSGLTPERTTSGLTASRLAPSSKILIFVNRSIRVQQLSAFLSGRGIPNVAVTSSGGARVGGGSGGYLASFLKDDRKNYTNATTSPLPTSSNTSDADTQAKKPSTQTPTPSVLITTSLLSRGLDFSPDVRHVFVLDTPRNMVDFLHRAGRTGRAGQGGRVVVFGKGRKGRKGRKREY